MNWTTEMCLLINSIYYPNAFGKHFHFILYKRRNSASKKSDTCIVKTQKKGQNIDLQPFKFSFFLFFFSKSFLYINACRMIVNSNMTKKVIQFAHKPCYIY